MSRLIIAIVLFLKIEPGLFFSDLIKYGIAFIDSIFEANVMCKAM